MRVTNISILANDIEVLKFSLREQDPFSRYIAKVIEGLDAEELIPKYYGRGLSTGKRFHEFAVKPRTLAMRLVLSPRFQLHETYSNLRDEIYAAISSQRSGLVEIQFIAAGVTVARLYGFITKLEADHFAPEPEVRLTLRCDDGLLRAVNPTILDIPSVMTANPVIFTDSTSTSPHGFRFEVEFTATEPSFTVRDAIDNDWEFTVVPDDGFVAGDRLVFSSEHDSVELYRVRGGVTTYLLDKVVPDSVWPILFRGANQFTFDEIDSFDWVDVRWYNAYWGV